MAKPDLGRMRSPGVETKAEFSCPMFKGLFLAETAGEFPPRSCTLSVNVGTLRIELWEKS
jgi:hypothetical protein